MNWKPKHPALQALFAAFLQETSSVYIVGGAVRDFLLGQEKEHADLDLVVAQPALATAQTVADRLGWAFYAMDEGRDIARLVFSLSGGEPLVCDVARMQGDSIEQDLRGRDFTVNAMAIGVGNDGSAELIDICGGQEDLRCSLLRRVSAVSLAEDAVRLIRAVRMSAQFGFTIEVETRAQIKRLSDTVRLASVERIRDELWKLTNTDRPAWAIEELRILSLLAHVLPEIAATIGIEQSTPHHLDVYSHTLETVRHIAFLRGWIADRVDTDESADVAAMQQTLAPWRFKLRNHFHRSLAANRSRVDWLVWHALMHDVGKPSTRTRDLQPDGSMRYRFIGHELVGAEMTDKRLSELRFSRQEIALSETVVRNHMRPHMLDASFAGQGISRRACYRYFREAGGRQSDQPPGVDTLLLALADMQAIYPGTPANWLQYLEHVGELLAFTFDDADLRTARQHPLVDGHRLMDELNLTPGPQLGELLEHLMEAQVAGDIETVDEALALASGWLNGVDESR